jgi:hypothetical protein
LRKKREEDFEYGAERISIVIENFIFLLVPFEIGTI